MRVAKADESERVAIRRKGGRMICGCCWGLVCLGVCADFVVWGLRKSSHGFASVARASGVGRYVVLGLGWRVWVKCKK